MYTCKNSFTAENGNFYRKDQNISMSDYEALSYDEQMNFFKNYSGSDHESRRSNDIVDDAIGIGVSMAIGSMFSDDSSSSYDSGSSSNSSSFSGFDGGDFGGGGASSDY